MSLRDVLDIALHCTQSISLDQKDLSFSANYCSCPVILDELQPFCVSVLIICKNGDKDSYFTGKGKHLEHCYPYNRCLIHVGFYSFLPLVPSSSEWLFLDTITC